MFVISKCVSPGQVRLRSASYRKNLYCFSLKSVPLNSCYTEADLASHADVPRASSRLFAPQ